MRTIFSFLVTSLFAITAYAANNWDEPCISGVCHYDLDPKKGPSSGTLKIWGSHKVISDITEAAGWRILECHEDDMEQVMRMFCFSLKAPCSHLFSHNGPENKIVRLPERCGKNPFARIVRVWTSHDQSFPPKLARRLQKRDGRLPLVYNVAFDTNFHAVDPIHGPVHFAVQAATIPTVGLDIDTHLPLEKRSGRPVQRSHKDIVARSLESIRNSIRSYVKDADDSSVNRRNLHEDVDKLKNGAVHFAKSAKNDVEREIPNHKTFIFSHNFNNMNMTLFDVTMNCPPFYFGLRFDVNPMGTIYIVMGVSVSGTVVPPNISAFKTVTHLTANLDVILTVNADVFIRLEKNPPPILTIPIESLEFPGILTLGPEFQMNLQAGVAVDIAIGTRIEILYHVRDAEIIFPHNGEKMTHPDVGFSKAHVKVSSTPFVRGVAQIDLHVIPTIFAGISAFGHSSGFNIKADSFLLVRLIIEANTKARPIKLRGFDDARHLINELPISARSMGEMGLGSTQGRNTVNVVATDKREVAPLPVGPGPWAGSGFGYLDGVKDPVTNTIINECFQVLVIIDISVGAIDVLFHVFDPNTRFSFYRQVYLLYQYCTGTSQPKGGSTVNQFKDWWKHPILPRRWEGTSPLPRTSLVKRGELKCSSVTGGFALMINTQNINLSETKPLH